MAPLCPVSDGKGRQRFGYTRRDTRPITKYLGTCSLDAADLCVNVASKSTLVLCAWPGAWYLNNPICLIPGPNTKLNALPDIEILVGRPFIRMVQLEGDHWNVRHLSGKEIHSADSDNVSVRGGGFPNTLFQDIKVYPAQCAEEPFWKGFSKHAYQPTGTRDTQVCV